MLNATTTVLVAIVRPARSFSPKHWDNIPETADLIRRIKATSKRRALSIVSTFNRLQLAAHDGRGHRQWAMLVDGPLPAFVRTAKDVGDAPTCSPSQVDEGAELHSPGLALSPPVTAEG